MTTYRYTDEALHERATAPNAMPGPIAEYRILIEVPFEVRDEIVSEAHTMGNYQGGRWSSCLDQAVTTWRRGGGFPFRARAKAHRDAEQALNDARRAVNPFADRVILPMN